MRLLFAYSLRFALYSLIFASLTLLAPFSASAASFSLGVYPPILEIIAKPGAEITLPLRVFNGPDPVTFKVSFVPFTALEETGQVALEKTAPQPYLDWIKLQSGRDIFPSETLLTLKPEESRDFQLKIAVPPQEKTADYYFTILFESTAFPAGPESFSQVSGAVGTNILLTISAITEYPLEGEILEFSAPRFLEGGPVPFTLRVKNTGQFHFAPSGLVEIKNFLGQKVGEVEVLPQNILAGTSRALVDLSQASPSAKLLIPAARGEPRLRRDSRFLTTPLVLWPSHFLIGKYTAGVTLSLSDWGPELTAQTNFWAFPVKWTIGMLVVLVLLFLFKRRLKKIVEK